MASAGKPAIAPLRASDLRSLQSAIDNIRERFANLESDLKTVSDLVSGSKSNKDIATLQAQVKQLAQQITTVKGNDAVSILEQLLTLGDGIVVLSGGKFVTRRLVPGANISITNPDGVAANPIISASTGPLGGATYPLRPVLFAAPQFNPFQPTPRLYHRP